MPDELKLNVYHKHREHPAVNQYEGSFFDSETGRFDGPWIGELFGQVMYNTDDVAEAIADAVEEEYPGTGRPDIKIYSDPSLGGEPLVELSGDGVVYSYCELTPAEAVKILENLREKLRHRYANE